MFLNYLVLTQLKFQSKHKWYMSPCILSTHADNSEKYVFYSLPITKISFFNKPLFILNYVKIKKLFLISLYILTY